MKKKTIGILLMISLVMIISIGAISATDANETLQGEVSDTNIGLADEVGDTNIAAASSDLKQEGNDTSHAVESVNCIDEINVDDSRNENHKVGVASSASNDVLSASNDDLLKHNENNFYYDGTGEWYYDFEDALSAAESNGGGTIKIWRGTYKYTSDSDDFGYKINKKGVSITIQPYNSDHQVIFDGENKGWFLHITNENIHVTISDITFKNGKGNDGPMEVEDGAQLTLYRCIFEGNHASSDGVSYGLGGAIIVDEGSLIANDCRFINNKADRYGGAICIEDSGSVTLNNCYFEGNKKGSDANDFEDYDIDSGASADWSFNNCLFVGSGSLDIDVDAPEKSVTITPNIDDDANLVVLYKDGAYYDEAPWASGHDATFTDLDKGTYTVYMMKDSEKRYGYSRNTFTIIEPNFILDDDKVFETLSDAVNAIPNGGSGVIAVKGGTYTGSGNRNVQINNKVVTIGPKSDSDHVTFSGDRVSLGYMTAAPSYFLDVGSNSKLTIHDITITGYFDDSALKFNANSEGSISDCKFNNIRYPSEQLGNPINAQNSNLALDGCTFEVNGPTLFKNTIVNIDDCTFTSNYGNYGGAINADSSTYLTVTNSKFSDNNAAEQGGAIYATNLELHDTEFIGNFANLGGAVYITSQSDSLINITYCVFDTNGATSYRNIYFESLTRKFNFEFNEYDLDLKIYLKDISYGSESILYGDFDWGSNLNNTYTYLIGYIDDENIFGDIFTVVNKKFEINLGVLPGGTHEIAMHGMYTQGDSNNHFYGGVYYSDLYENQFYLANSAYAKIGIDKANISLVLEVKDVLIPETPVLNVYADRDLNYTIFIQNKYYQVEVVNGKGSMQLTGLDLGNYTVVAMRDADENYELAMNFTTFAIAKTYSNFLVLSTNVEYDTLNEAVANSNDDDTIYVKKGTYKNTGIVISNKILEIIALEGAVFDAQGADANFIIVNENAVADISGITFRGLHNRNTNYGAIVNHGYLSLTSCNFTDNKITKTTFAENGGAAIFSDGDSLEIDGCNFINNVAPLKVSTAAVTSLGHEDVSISDSKFINNTAREGGALHFKNIIQFEAAITSCNFERNTAVKGSAIYVGNNSRYISVTSSDFKKNDIKNNLGEKAQLEGGVIYVNANDKEVTFDVSSSNFEDNSNSNVDGGVICLDGSSKATIESCIFTNNRGKVGSVILIKNPYDKKLTLIMDSSAFRNNNATNGAIATSPKVTALIDECVFANNTGQNRHIYSNGFTVVHDSIFDVKDAKLNAPSVQYGESSTITGTADIGTNTYAAANLTVAGENNIVEIKNNAFTYNVGILNHGKYYAVLNSIVDNNNNIYLMDSITEIFRVTRDSIDINVSVDNITYGETLKVVESLPSNATGTLVYQLNGKYYTKDEIESLKLDAGKYTLVAIYDYDDFAFTSTTVNFEVYKANPTISVPNVDVKYNDSIILNIESDVASIYTIEIEDYRNVVFVNGSRTIVIDKTLNPGNYTIKVTSQERVNYISNSTEAILNVNENLPVFGLRISNTNADDMGTGNVGETDSAVDVSNNVQAKPLLAIRYFAIDDAKSNENLSNSPDNSLGEEYEEGKFLFQYDEDDDYSYFDTLEDAVDEAVLYGAGIITVRGGTYYISSMDIEGEVELTIKTYEDEEVIFDCGGEYYFMLLTYDTEMEWVQVPPPPHPEFEQTDGPTVTLENITVINGYAKYGGAIDLEAGTLILNNCNFRNNYAYDEGGAIYIGKWDAEYDATVIAVNTTFTNNYAESEGGAIYIASDNLDGQSTSASFYLCTFLDNYQGEDEDRVRNYFAGGNVDEITCQYCIFNANGEIYNFTMDKINQAVYVKGTSNDTFDSVVLLYFDTAPLYTINNNGSRDFNITFEDVMGGNYTVGVMNDHDFNTYIFDVKFEMKVPNFIISEDEVYENLTDAIDAVSENGVIYANANYYLEEQMGIDISKSFTLKNFRGRDVVFDGNSTTWFFTIAEGNTVEFEGIYFTDGAIKNHASIENYGTLVINNCTFDSFETAEIIYNSGLLNILNSTFSLNFVDNAVLFNDGQLFIDTVEFSSNVVNTSSVVYTNGAAEIVGSNFTENYNFGNGGAIYNAKSLSVKDTVFTENEGYNGGSVYNEGTLEVINSTFEDNTANGYGGAIYNGNEANIFNSTFTGSSSEKDGGAIYNNNIMAVDNSTFVGNAATGRGGAIYNNISLVLIKSLFGINYAEEFANIYNAGDIQFSENMFDFYDVILVVPDGEYGIPTTITGTLNPEFNMDLQTVLPGFVNHKDAAVTISEGVFEYTTDILPKGIYDVVLNEVIYDIYGNIYYGEAIIDRLIINKANVYINLTVDDIVLKNTDQAAPVLKISASKDGLLRIVFNNKILEVNIGGGQATLTLDAVGEGNYTVFAAREGDENYKDAVNTTSFKVTEYEGNFIVNSTGGKYDTLREAISATLNDDVIYVMEGNYSGGNNLGLVISGKKLSIIPLGDVVFDGESSNNYFMYVRESADVTICDVVITGFKTNAGSWVKYYGTFENHGNLTLDGCTFAKNTISGDTTKALIYNEGNLNIVECGFYDHAFRGNIINSQPQSNLIVNESTFEKNALNNDLISIDTGNSVKIISSEFAENMILSQDCSIIKAISCKDVLISSAFYNNTQINGIIAYENTNLCVDNSIFTGNTLDCIINSGGNTQNTISRSVFTDNSVENVVLSSDKNLSVLESTFSDNTGLSYGALFISGNATVNGSVFLNNKAIYYRNIYSDSSNVKITNSVFDAVNVDYTVHDVDYGQTETIEGTIDIGTNLNLPVILDINSKSYSVNVTDNKFTYNAGILNGGDYNVVLNPKDDNSNTFVFDKITKMFTVNRIDPGLSISIADITQGEKLKVNLTISKNVSANVVYELGGKTYSKKELENLTLAPGNYLVTAIYRGDKNFLSATAMDNVVVHKVAPNITVNDVAVSYGDEIKINVSVDVADYYTVFLDNRYNESISLYVENSAIFTFPSESFKPGSYEIVAYVFESDDYAEEYAYATLTINNTVGVFNLTNDTIIFGENATISVEVPFNAYGNIRYEIYDEDKKLVYSTTQSCLEELVVPNLSAGSYVVTGTFEGDSYYTNESIINSGEIFVRAIIDVNINVYDIIYGENATFTIESSVDGEYIVCVGTEPMVVTVINGAGNVPVSNLNVGNYAVNVTIVDDKYFAFNETTFDVTPKPVSVAVSVEDIVSGEIATVFVNGEIDGKYIVKIYDKEYTVNVAGGKGSVPIYNLGLDKDILVSVSIADGNYSAYNTTTFNVVNKYNTPIGLDVGIDEDYVTMTVTVSDAATGLVKFQVSGQEEYSLYVDVVNGKAVLEDILEIGDYTVVVTYLGDTKFNTNITYEDFTIKGHIKKDTPISAYADVNGYRVTVTVNVDENATGFVKLAVGGTVANIEVVDGVATLTTSLMPNSYYLDVTYLGDDDYNMNSTMLTFTVTEISKENTTIDLNILVYEDTALIMVDLNESATGLVKFYMISKETGENYTMYMDVVNGHVETFTNSIAPGNYSIVATYMGDSVFNTNTTSQDVEIIGHVLKDTPIDANVETNLNKVTLTVAVDENATGFVEIKFGDSVFNIALEKGKGTFVTTLPYGSYSLNITYLGDENYNKNSTRREFTLVEPVKENTPISLDIVTNETYVGMTVTVSDAATGLVKFQVTGAEEYVVYSDVVDGKAILENILEIGDYAVTVTYMGDDRFNTNLTYQEFAIAGHIKKDTPIKAYADVNGYRVTITVVVDENATGFVKLAVGGTVANIEVVDGVATITTSLMPNSYFVDVTYLGDDDYNMNKTKLTFTVTEITKENTPIDLNILVYEDTALIMVDLNETATGLVKFYMISKETGENYTMYMDVVDGHVETFTNSIAPGNYSVTATYMGDSVFNTNTITEDVEILGHILIDTQINASDVYIRDGQNATIAVTVPSGATGVVFVEIDGKKYYDDIADGNATVIVSGLAPDTYVAVISYSGDDNYTAATTSINVTVVELINPDMNVTITENIKVGDDVNITITVPEGAVNNAHFDIYLNGRYHFIVLENATTVVPLYNLGAGIYNLEVTYSGNEFYYSDWTMFQFSVTKIETTIGASDVFIKEGETADIVVTLPGDATGVVLVDINGSSYYANVTDGSATIAVKYLIVGNYSAVISYTGDDTYAPGKATANIYVVPTDSGFDVVPGAAEIDYGESIVFEIVIDENATGNIEYFWYDFEEDEYISIFNQTVEEAREIGFEVNYYRAGMNLFIASYSGDGSFIPSDAAFAVKVNKIVLTEEDIRRLGSISTYGYDSSVILVMEDEFSDATGNITLVYYDIFEGYIYYNGTVEGGTGIIVLPVMDVGDYSGLLLIYSGDDKYAGLTTTVSFEVLPIETVMSVVPSENNKVGDVANVTVAVGPAYPIDPEISVPGLTGAVDVYVDGNLVAEGAELVNGAVIVPVKGLAAGNHTVAVYYGGDGIYDESAGNATLKVDKVNPIIVIDDIAANVDEAVEVNVTIEGGDATGYLFFDGVLYIVENGQSTISVVIEHAGMQAITVTYLGDDKYNNETGVKAFNAGKAAPEVEADVPIEAYVGEDVVVEVTVSPEDATGTVTVYVDGEEYVTCDVDDEVIITGLANGTHVIGVKYNGNINYNASEVVEYTIVVNRNNLTDVVIFVPETEYGENTTVVVILPEDSTGTVTVTVNDSEYTADVENGVAKVNIPALDAGKYDDVPVAYSGDGKYSPYENTTSFEVDSQYVDWGALISSEEIDLNETVIIIYNPIVDEGIGYVLPDDCVVYIKVNGEDYGNYTSEQFKEGIVVDAFSEYGTYTVTVGIADDPNYTFAEPIDYSVAVLRDSKINVTVPSDIKAGNNATIIISIPNATGIVIVSVDGNETPVPLVDGVAYFTMDNVTVGPHSVLVTYPGDDANRPAYTIVEVTVPRINTYIEIDKTFTRNATDYNAGERGAFFYAVLKDENGNLLVNKTVAIAVNGPIYYVTTDDHGRAGLQVNLASANTYTYALSFVGDDEYNAAPLACTKLLVIKKKTSIVASAASFKSTAKTKIVTATLKTIKNAYDGKTYLKAGKQLTLTIDGKTYKATAGANGVVKFNIGSFTKKGTFNAVIKFAGDRTYESAIKTIKITIS